MGSMAMSKDWKRLGHAVRERRVDLDMTQEDVRAAGGPSTATMRLIEGGLQDSYQPSILARLEEALRWRRGSVRAVLAGGDPDPLEETPAPPRLAVVPAAGPQADREVRAALAAALAAVNAPLRDVVLAEVRAGIPFADPVERAIWDSPDWSDEEKAEEIANYRARRAALGGGGAASAG